MRVAYFDLGFSREQYGLQPTRYGGGAVAARYLKEDPEIEFHVFASAEAFENVGPTERLDHCHGLEQNVLDALRGGYPLHALLNIGAFDLVMHGHTCATLNKGYYPVPLCHFCGFDGSAGHPGNDYVLLYDPSFKPAFGERAKYVRIGKPVPATWPGYESRERLVFSCSRHDDHMASAELAKRCLAEGFKGVFAGPIHNGYPLLDYIDGKTTVYLGEITEAAKLDWCRRASLFGLLLNWEAPFNQSVIEAQGQGTPIYTYPRGPFLKSYLQHGRNGFDASQYSLTTAHVAADAGVSYASWAAADQYSIPVMIGSFKRAFAEIVAEWKAAHP